MRFYEQVPKLVKVKTTTCFNEDFHNFMWNNCSRSCGISSWIWIAINSSDTWMSLMLQSNRYVSYAISLTCGSIRLTIRSCVANSSGITAIAYKTCSLSHSCHWPRQICSAWVHLSFSLILVSRCWTVSFTVFWNDSNVWVLELSCVTCVLNGIKCKLSPEISVHPRQLLSRPQSEHNANGPYKHWTFSEPVASLWWLLIISSSNVSAEFNRHINRIYFLEWLNLPINQNPINKPIQEPLEHAHFMLAVDYGTGTLEITKTYFSWHPIGLNFLP